MAKIGINATLLTPKSGGIGEYMIQLIRHILDMDEHNEYVIFISCKYQHLLQKHIPNANLIAIDLPVENQIQRTCKEPFIWPKVLKHAQIDLFHSPVSYIPLGVNMPALVTVHDLRYWHFPETYPKLRGLYLSKMIPRSVRKAQHVIAISEYTKEDLIEQFSIKPEKISVIHQGLDLKKFEMCSEFLIQECREKYNLPEKYILSLGHLEPRKNYVRLIEAFNLLVENGCEHHLVIAGKEYYDYEKIYNTVQKLRLGQRVHFTGFVADEHLPPLYQQADLFVAPSIFEGFGFTPLEAMAAGVPAVAAAATSFPEVLGDAALYFDPYDIDDMAEKISLLIQAPELRVQLIQKSKVNIQRFQWKKCCKETYQIYKEFVA